jgi:hypothetical protein
MRENSPVKSQQISHPYEVRNPRHNSSQTFTSDHAALQKQQQHVRSKNGTTVQILLEAADEGK